MALTKQNIQAKNESEDTKPKYDTRKYTPKEILAFEKRDAEEAEKEKEKKDKEDEEKDNS